MYNKLNYKQMHTGGGYRPKPDIIKIKVKEYRRRKHLPPERYTITERRTIAYVLDTRFGLTHNEIADFLNITPRTVKNDIKLMTFNVKVYKLDKKRVEDLYDYIIYNARYIH